MKLRIIDTSWGINRKTGAFSESEVSNDLFEAKVGELPPVGPSGHKFRIEEVKEDSVVVYLSMKQGTVEVKKGEPYEYRPFSMDGGHRYKLEVE